MKHRIFLIAVVLSMVATPLMAAVNQQPSCAGRDCCCRPLMDAHRHGSGAIEHDTCNCQSLPFSSCRLEPNSFSPQPAITVTTHKGCYPDRLPLVPAIEADAAKLLQSPPMATRWWLQPISNQPPTFLLSCSLII